MVIWEGETLVEVEVEVWIHKKLQVPDEEFSKVYTLLGHLWEKTEKGNMLHRAFDIFLLKSKYDLPFQISKEQFLCNVDVYNSFLLGLINYCNV